MMRKFNDFVYVITVILVCILTVGLIIYGVKSFNTATTPITLHDKDGAVCALAVTTDGVAIDCDWSNYKGGK